MHKTAAALNPNRLAPDELVKQLGPFGSWPASGLPEGYFPLPLPEAAGDFYREQGWLVVPDALSPQEVQALRAKTTQLCRNEDGSVEGIPVASAETPDEEALKRVLCLHFPHKLAPEFKQSVNHPAIVETLTRVIGPNVKCMQSMLFVKASGKPGQAWHQDEDYIPTRDRSLAGAWIALDDATVTNGCLWVLSGSHQRGLLWPQKFHFDHRFDCSHETFDFPWDDADSVPVEVKAGSIVFFNGYLLHRSLPNRAETGFRRSLVNHYMSAESLLPWMRPDEKTSMALADYRDVILIAGKDPYAYKGTTDIAKAFIRSDGKGGCADWNDEEQKQKAIKHQKSKVS